MELPVELGAYQVNRRSLHCAHPVPGSLRSELVTLLIFSLFETLNLFVFSVFFCATNKVTASRDDNSFVILTFSMINLRAVHSSLNLPQAS